MQQSTTQKSNAMMILIAYAVVYIVWGSTFFFIEKALHSFTPFVLGSLRFLTASIILMAYCKIKGYKLFNKKIVLQSFVVGFLLLFIDMAGVIWAEQYISSGIVAIISAAAAIWFILLDKRKWKENFRSLPIVIGLFMGFLGVVMLFGEQIANASSADQKSNNTVALTVLVIGSIAWTAGSLYSKYSKEDNQKEAKPTEDLHVMVKTAWQLVIAGVMFTLVALSNGEYSKFNLADYNGTDWFYIAYLIVFGSILAFSSYIWLLQVRPATEVSTYAYINPIVALVLSHFFTSHQVTSLQLIGLVIILSAVLLMNWNLYKDNKTIVKFKDKVGFRTNKIRLQADFKKDNLPANPESNNLEIH